MKKRIPIFLLIFGMTACGTQNKLKETCNDSTPEDFHASISFYLNRLSKDSLDQVSYYKIGMAHYKLKHLDSAVFYFDRLMILNADYPGASSNRGLCKLFMNNVKGACDDFKFSISRGQDPAVIDGMKLSEWIKKECLP